MTKDEYSFKPEDVGYWECINKLNARKYARRGIISHEFADYIEEMLAEEGSWRIINITNSNTNKKG